jgi:hypothetical protein
MTTTATVNPLTKFRHKNEDGILVTSTAPMGVEEATEVKYYYISNAAAKMHRPDGFPIGFIKHVHATKLMATQWYLDMEIESGHPYLRKATTEEVHMYKMTIDPKATITEEVQEEVKNSVTAELMKKLVEDGLLAADIAATYLQQSGGKDIQSTPTDVINTGNAQLSLLKQRAASLQQSVVGSNKVASGAADSGS